MISESYLQILQIAIGLVFLVAGLVKLKHLSSFVAGIDEFRVLPSTIAAPFGWLIVVCEIAIGSSHITGYLTHAFLPIALSVLCAFLFGTVTIFSRGQKVNCMCFGVDEGTLVSGITLVRICLLIIAESLLFEAVLMQRYEPVLIFALTWSEYIGNVVAAIVGLLVATWLLRIPDIRKLMRECMNCKSGETRELNSLVEGG